MAKREVGDSKALHFIGIKGMGMSALAVMAHQLGYEVTGSDVDEKFPTDRVLEENGIQTFKSFDPEHIKHKPTVVISAAYGMENPEVKEVKKLRLKVKAYSEMLGELMQQFEGIGVSGVHGKTTTSSLLAYILSEAGLSPSYLIGAPYVAGLKGNGHIGDGKYFVVEADEYKKSDDDKTPKFFDLPLKHVIITNIELDHPDVYQTAEEVYQAFYQMSIKIPRDGTIVACIDWPLVKRLVNRRVDRSCLTYGLDSTAQFQVVDIQQGETTTFSIKAGEKKLGPFTMKLAGAHNALNATSAIIMALRLGVTEAAITKALRTFEGPYRRFQVLGEYEGATIVDDYAHHPTAIREVIKAAKHRYPTKRIIVVFQPHTYSRTGKLLKEFAHSLTEADKVILLNIFASAREKSGYVTIKDLIDVLRPLKPDMEYRGTIDEVTKLLRGVISSKDIVLLMGAGNVYKIFDQLKSPDN